jgi:hypothetical protein
MRALGQSIRGPQIGAKSNKVSLKEASSASNALLASSARGMVRKAVAVETPGAFYDLLDVHGLSSVGRLRRQSSGRSNILDVN